MSRKKKSAKPKPDATLHRYNVDLIRCIDEMRYKRDELHKDIYDLTEEQKKIESDLGTLTVKLADVNENLCRKCKDQAECDTLIMEYEKQKLVQGSENLLGSMRLAVGTVAPELLTARHETPSSFRKSRSPSRQTTITRGSLSKSQTQMSLRLSTSRMSTGEL
ncbi:Hypothetical predicted protein [Mytilus galloprovincialis]|uniref:Uncharacterized protein n=1 Tax=Mytilus galloprovincialis TaxID=29158 RepID=A0A8B6BZX2_MYTGA|nr:Hypothetical predicted protein [Mytilus galloprovincialis]